MLLFCYEWQVIDDCPAFVKVEQDAEAFLTNDKKQKVTIKAMAILELKNILHSYSGIHTEAEFSDGIQTYTFSENDNVNFTIVEKDTLYSLNSLPQINLLPKVIVFHEITPHNIALKDVTLRSAMCTIVEGPIEILDFVNVEYLTCWTRQKRLKTFETVLIPRQLWNKVSAQKRCLHSEDDREKHLTKKFGSCLRSQFVSKSLYFMQNDASEVTWLRCPEFFKQHLEGNTLYDVIRLPFYDSSDDENIYQDIEEPVPRIPERGNTDSKIITSVIDDRKKMFGNMQASIRANTGEKGMPPKYKKSTEMVETEIIGSTKQEKILAGDQLQRSLPSIPERKNTTRDNKYTKLEVTKPSRVYESLDVYGDSLPLGYSKNIPDKSQQYLEVGQVKKVLQENQTEEDFYNYTVKEVSFCFEHCGLKSLADICYDKKLDGSFFRGFSDWQELNLSNLDVIILKKMIYEGWRSKDDSTYAISTHM
ncbi:uncharacterized protein LOC132733677 isoform X2 [Ruditapes philippinarum]|uniref:uncharacterized protein LOC132733677 isoform X2 n=1 Tax=Ruditapes philippinarum TaxID=129788 RepID=UPI00295B56ED|nr:uncharacterized protein LOC132733677 isoform X2 [Ruditapes philippinarum]